MEIVKNFIKELKDSAETLEANGCLSGDCPHNKYWECDMALMLSMVEIRQRLSKIYSDYKESCNVKKVKKG